MKINLKNERKIKVKSTINILVFITLALLFILIGGMSEISVQSEREKPNGFITVESNCVEKESENSPIGVFKEYSFEIDALSRDETLAFYTVHQYVRVFVDGECIYELQPSGKWNMCKTVGCNWNMIPLYREDSGKTITVQIIPVYESFRNRKVDFLVGDGIEIYRDRLSKDILQIVLSCIAIFVGLVFLMVAIYRYICNEKEKDAILLGIFSVMIGVWRLTDTRFTPFIFPNHSVLVYNLSLGALMFGIVPLLKWVQLSYKGRLNKILQYCSVLSLAIGVVQVLLQLFGIWDLRETLFVTHIMIGINAMVLIVIFLVGKKKSFVGERKEKGNNFFYVLIIGVILDILAFKIKGNSSGLVFSLLAYVIYIILIGILMMFNYRKKELELAEKDKQIAEKEKALMEKRIFAMASQIKSHFIFNVLTAISGYCKTDPQKADKILIRFSRYLRKNVRIIETEGLVDFTDELEQVEDYVALEQIRFGDMIAFEEDIQETQFKIPPLTIQPLVENAIKHGLIEPNRSGVITLTTKRNGDYVEIIVADNGVGFDPCDKNGKDSVGIKNVCFRLENMTNGELHIESAVGKGTSAIVKLPFNI